MGDYLRKLQRLCELLSDNRHTGIRRPVHMESLGGSKKDQNQRIIIFMVSVRLYVELLAEGLFSELLVVHEAHTHMFAV